MADDRFIVDTASTSTDSWKDGVDVIRELPQIDIAVVRGSEDDLSGVRFERDAKLDIAPPESHSPDELPDPSDEDPEFLAGGPGNPSALQWDKQSLGVDEIHGDGITGSDVTISIVDNGVDPSHPDVNYDVDGSNTVAESAKPIVETPGAPIPPNEGGVDAITEHGTHCAGIAAGTGDTFVLGNAPGATIISQNIAVAGGGAYSSDIATGVVLSADNGADVLNLSFGSYPNPPSISTKLSGDMAERAATHALENGTLPVTSAGNSAVNLDTDGDYVSRYADVPGFMPVSSTGPIGFSPESVPPGNPLANGNAVDGDLDAPMKFPSFFTTYGANALSVSAPGGNAGSTSNPGYFYDLVFSAIPQSVGGAGWKAGTSMAAPQVAGIAGLVAGEHSSATPGQIRRHIENTAYHVQTEYEQPENIDVPSFFGPNGYLVDPYDSETYRGNGHVDLQQAAGKSIPFPRGIDVTGQTVYPADPDNDGLYEDVNGDGVVDMDDVELLYQIALRNVVDPETDAFDFDGNGQFDMYDVQALVREVQS